MGKFHNPNSKNVLASLWLKSGLSFWQGYGWASGPKWPTLGKPKSYQKGAKSPKTNFGLPKYSNNCPRTQPKNKMNCRLPKAYPPWSKITMLWTVGMNSSKRCDEFPGAELQVWRAGPLPLGPGPFPGWWGPSRGHGGRPTLTNLAWVWLTSWGLNSHNLVKAPYVVASLKIRAAVRYLWALS